MIYFREEMVHRAVEELSRLHPFFGITFLVCKKAELPIGSDVHFAINRAEQNFLDAYYRPDLNSTHYFQPFRLSGTGRWLVHKYPWSGSQSTRTRGHLAKAFIHPRASDLWGWADDYVTVLRQKLNQDQSGKVPAFWLAVWLYRNESFRDDIQLRIFVHRFLDEYKISTQERSELFDTYVPVNLEAFSDQPLNEKKFLQSYPPAPDALPEEGGVLADLALRSVGPARQLDFAPAQRLSIITGDNGLGKTFLLECAWWGLTGSWAEKQAVPAIASEPASIAYSIRSPNDILISNTVLFDKERLRWPEIERTAIAGLIVYARVDGSFAIWDPARVDSPEAERSNRAGFLQFSREDVLKGYEGKIEGLLRDWVRWQNSRDQTTFDAFCAVLEQLSPPDMRPLKAGEPIRVIGESKDIPTLVHEYGIVPFTNESAGVRRIVTLAYLLVWAWNEHRVYSSYINKSPQDNVIIMVDEIEAHLHPKWQRSILPALLGVAKGLSPNVNPQMIVATHSPLILASIEAQFDEEMDKLFHLHLDANRAVTVDEIDYVKRGTVDEWLTSEVFELKEPRSRESEAAIEMAKKLLAESSENVEEIKNIDRRLREELPSEDLFWPRWLHFMKAKRAL